MTISLVLLSPARQYTSILPSSWPDSPFVRLVALGKESAGLGVGSSHHEGGRSGGSDAEARPRGGSSSPGRGGSGGGV